MQRVIIQTKDAFDLNGKLYYVSDDQLSYNSKEAKTFKTMKAANKIVEKLGVMQFEAIKKEFTEEYAIVTVSGLKNGKTTVRKVRCRLLRSDELLTLEDEDRNVYDIEIEEDDDIDEKIVSEFLYSDAIRRDFDRLLEGSVEYDWR